MAATRLPIDASAFPMIATGKFRPVAEYAELSDGSRRVIPGSQATVDGVPLYQADVILDDDESDRSVTASVKFTSQNPPELPKYQPVQFVGLVCTPYVDRRTNRVALSFSAAGIAGQGAPSSGRKSAASAEG
ncbi:hypothetical protein [Amycolatopsis sacchari]|uniref:hypothetical protein n=1 Tax=Amycolatopsis sacchari TaxID=115433 RepID=UPI003D75E415